MRLKGSTDAKSGRYRETIDYLYSRLPVFHQIGAAAYRPDLGNIKLLCEALDHPYLRFRSVHIGGTNGKGSVSHMLAAVLQTAGYKTGLYTSPHLRDFRERIRVNGAMIAEDDVVGFVANNRARIETISPSFFEVTVAMAFWYFALQKVDIAIIEVGMGGRLDSTNIIHPELSVITNIGLDHVHVLGDTLQAIAGEKAGIIKKSTPVIIGEYQDATAAVFREKAEAMKAPLRFASQDWEVSELPPANLPTEETRLPAEDAFGAETPSCAVSKGPTGNPKLTGESFMELIAASETYGKQLTLQLDLAGGYQKKNLKTVLSAVEELRKRGFNINDNQLKKALRQVKALTGLAGRWQILGRAPLVVCDTGHNEDGIREVLQQIAATPHEQLHVVFGMVSDKDVEKVLKMLPKQACYYFCRAVVPRAMDENLLREKGLAAGLSGEAYPSVKDAVEAAKKAAGARDLIFIGGSTFIVAEVV